MDPTAQDTLDESGASPLDLFSNTPTYPAVTDPSENPSNGLDINGLMSNLIGTAGSAFNSAQNSAAAQSIAQAQIASQAASPSNPLAIFTGSSGSSWLLIGAGVIVLALILRK